MPRSWMVLFVAIPAVVATALLAGIVVGENDRVRAVGTRVENVAEAAGSANASEVIRLMHAGEDPSRVYPVRDWVISSSVRHATGLEAALWSRHIDMIRLLDQEHALGDLQVRHDLACLAEDLHEPDIAQYLTGGGEPRCVPGRALARVIARTTGGPVS